MSWEQKGNTAAPGMIEGGARGARCPLCASTASQKNQGRTTSPCPCSSTASYQDSIPVSSSAVYGAEAVACGAPCSKRILPALPLSPRVYTPPSPRGSIITTLVPVPLQLQDLLHHQPWSTTSVESWLQVQHRTAAAPAVRLSRKTRSTMSTGSSQGLPSRVLSKSGTP